MTDKPNPTSQDGLHAAARALVDLHERSETWRRNATHATSVDEGDLRRRTRTCRHILHAAARPPAVGVFGESQAGKSFLISCMSGSAVASGLVVEEPQLAKSGDVDPSKLWAADAKRDGGLSFIRWINAQSGNESTALVCRFTRRPADRPFRDDAFVGRLLSHEDLLASLALGYIAEVDRDARQSAVENDLRKAMDEIAKEPLAERGVAAAREIDLAWRHIRSSHPTDGYVAALEAAGFGEFVGQFIRGNRAPEGAAWLKMAGLLWGYGRNPAIDRLYDKLRARMEALGWPELVEIPTAAVVKLAGEDGQLPLTDVNLLRRIFKEGNSVRVGTRRDGEATLRDATLSRAELSALILELVLPVKAPSDGQGGLLAEADLLDFPGARASRPVGQTAPADEDARDEIAVAVLRRGKLTRTFGALAERRLINVLCLTVPKTNLEAAPEISTMLRCWFRSRPESRSEADRPDLLVAITKSDQIIDEFPTARWPAGERGFGGFIDDLREAYTTKGGDFDWMDRFPGAEAPFADVSFVFNAVHHPLRSDVRGHRAELREHFLTHPSVIRHVADPETKFEAMLAGDGGASRFATEVVERVRAHNLPMRLAREIDAMRRDLLRMIEGEAVGPQNPNGRTDPSGDATRDLDALARAVGSAPRNSQNRLAIFLERIRMPTSLAEGVVRRLDAAHGRPVAGGIAVTMTCKTLIQELRMAWSRMISEQLSDRERTRDLDLPDDVVDSLRLGLVHGVEQPWMSDALESVLSDFIEMPAARRQPSLVAAAVWTWNRHIVELGDQPPAPPKVPLPPTLTADGNPPWTWLFDHWRRRLPIIYGATRQPPPGNDALLAIVAELRRLEVRS